MWQYSYGRASKLAINGPGKYLRKHPDEIGLGCPCLFSGGSADLYGTPNFGPLRSLDVPGDVYPYILAGIGDRNAI